MVIRQAAVADVAAIEAIVTAAFTPYIARIGRPPGPMLEDYAALVRDGAVWLHRSAARIDGVLVLLREPTHLLVDVVAVDPSMRGRGVGRALLEFAEQHAATLGLGELQLFTHQLMFENIALYARTGWREIDRRVEAGFPRVYMRKTVSRSPP